VKEISKRFPVTQHYIRQILNFEVRQTEDSGSRHRATLEQPLVPLGYVRSTSGWSYRRRGRAARFRAVIPFAVVCQIRLERKELGLTMHALAARHGVSPGYVLKIIQKKVRVLG
jgi:hypothetical protein